MKISVKKVFTSSWKKKRLVLQAYFFLYVAKGLIFLGSFKATSNRLSKQKYFVENAINDRDELLQIHRAVYVASKFTPFLATCLTQAIAGKILCNRHRINSTIYLGIAKEDGLKAHAWLNAMDMTITGGGLEKERYTMVGIF